MPKPVESSQRYMPGLDGLRAVAVLAVIAYHLEFGWAEGGLLGVGVFFTLSGYLITDLLLGRREAAGRLRLGDFWLRRARRLLPALFLMLAVVVVWVAFFHPSRMAELRGEVLAAVLYISNWWYIFHDVSYFANFGPPPTLGHLWSLAVEEQFYVLWPLLLWLGLFFVRSYKWLAILTVVIAAVSAVLMAVMYQPGTDPTRIYDGTDTRAFGLLAGAALAMVWPSHLLSPERVLRRDRFLLDGVGISGLLVILLLVWQTNQYSGFLYRGGIVLLSLATVFVVAAVAHPSSRLGPALGCAPMRWIGVRSYGIYLWHYPIIILTTPAMTEDAGLSLDALQIAATIAVAALSWRFVEEPIRRGAIGRFRERIRSGEWRTLASPRVWTAVAGTLCITTLAGAGLAGVIGAGSASPPPPGESGGRIEVSAESVSSARPSTAPEETTSKEMASGETAPEETTSPGASTPVVEEEGEPAPPPATRTSCEAVAYIGDSTSEGMISANYLPDPSQRLDARFANVGATEQVLDISGARSIIETLPGQVGGYDAARQIAGAGFEGCWVIALGGNDTANVYMGSQIGLEERIERIMEVAGDKPVMWVTVRTLLGGGPYAQANMDLWNQTLKQSCEKYPNMKIYDWASAIDDTWFIDDGTHFTSEGYAHRSRLTAAALVKAFPASGENGGSGCVVR